MEHFDIENDIIPFYFIELAKAEDWFLPSRKDSIWALFKNTIKPNSDVFLYRVKSFESNLSHQYFHG